jgi:single-stranded DNA-binding protein
MRGHNFVWLSGNIGGKIVSGKTRDNEPAYSFSIATDDGVRPATWVRINTYSQLALRCQQRVVKGIYAIVAGELMNREGKCGELTEIRAKDIVFFPAAMIPEPEKESANGKGSETKSESQSMPRVW